MTSDTQKAREWLALEHFNDDLVWYQTVDEQGAFNGMKSMQRSRMMAMFAAHVTAQKDAEIAKAKHLASAFGETITNIAVKVLGLSDPNLPGDGADWDSDKTFSESVIESFAALRAQAEKDKAEIERLAASLSQYACVADAASSDVVDDRLHTIPELRGRIAKLEEALRKITEDEYGPSTDTKGK